MNGTAQIVSGFLGFGVLHIHTQRFEPWQWLMIITGMVTLLVAVMYWLFFPDSPTNAWFLTPAERLVAITRLRVNQTGVENKQFKPAQMVEALMDPKTWLFALFALLANIPNSLTNQRQLIVASFGFGQLQVTLLGCVDGFMEIVSIAIGVWLAARRPNMRAWVAVSFFTANILGAILVSVLPWHDKIGLLFSIWVTGTSNTLFEMAKYEQSVRFRCGIVCTCLGLGRCSHRWAHEKSNYERDHALRILHRECSGALHVAGQIQAQVPRWRIHSLLRYHDNTVFRNRVPWTVIGICGVICPLLLLAIRALLARENRCRDAEHVAGKDDGYGNVRTLVDDGKGGHIECQIDRVSVSVLSHILSNIVSGLPRPDGPAES
jgi:ACS family allantoate permease-like MFS transporter